MAFSSGDFKEFIDEPSYRGWHLEGRHLLLDNKISIGFGFGWSGFYKDFGRSMHEFDGGAITSNMYRYLYTTSLDANVHYYVLEDDVFIQPYVGFQFGPHYYRKQTQVGSYYVEDETWDFAIAPELGFFIPFGEDSEWGFNTSARYNYAFYTQDNFEGLSYLQVNIGLSYKY